MIVNGLIYHYFFRDLCFFILFFIYKWYGDYSYRLLVNNIHEIGKVVEEVFYLYVVSTQSPVFKCMYLIYSI